MAEALVKELGIDDLYGFLGVPNDAGDKQITSAYRKKALRYHPDKNTDDSAVLMFHKIARVYQVLCDPAAKAAYDKWLKARDAAQRRHNELNAKRRKLKEDLLSKEGQDTASGMSEVEASEKMKIEIERLREQSISMIREQEEQLRQRMAQQLDEDADMFPTLKVTWPKSAAPLYSEDKINQLFRKYGPLEHVLVSKKMKAVIAFTRAEDAIEAMESERGFPDAPLKVTWLAGHHPIYDSDRAKITGATQPGREEGRHNMEDKEAAIFALLKKAEEHKQLLS